MHQKITVVYKGKANWGRSSVLTLDGDMVEFDCSDKEYGPIRFPLQTLIDAINTHTGEDISEWDTTLMDGLEDEDFSSWTWNGVSTEVPMDDLDNQDTWKDKDGKA